MDVRHAAVVGGGGEPGHVGHDPAPDRDDHVGSGQTDPREPPAERLERREVFAPSPSAIRRTSVGTRDRAREPVDVGDRRLGTTRGATPAGRQEPRPARGGRPPHDDVVGPFAEAADRDDDSRDSPPLEDQDHGSATLLNSVASSSTSTTCGDLGVEGAGERRQTREGRRVPGEQRSGPPVADPSGQRGVPARSQTTCRSPRSARGSRLEHRSSGDRATTGASSLKPRPARGLGQHERPARLRRRRSPARCGRWPLDLGVRVEKADPSRRRRASADRRLAGAHHPDQQHAAPRRSSGVA